MTTKITTMRIPSAFLLIGATWGVVAWDKFGFQPTAWEYWATALVTALCQCEIGSRIDRAWRVADATAKWAKLPFDKKLHQ